MENMRIRLRFSSIMKNISKNNFKYQLEIVPLITSLENIDEIKWKHKIDEIEYMFPVNHKVIIKKLKPNPEAIKMYYSCVDLLPSILSKVDIDSGDIYRVISDNNITINKEKSDFMPLTNMPPIDIKMDKTMHHVRNKSTNSTSHCNEIPFDLSDYLITSSSNRKNRVEKIKNESVQIDKNEAVKKISSRRIVNNTNVECSTSTSVLQNDYNTKLYVILKCNNMQPNNAKDYFVLDSFRKNKDSSLVANILPETNYSKYNKEIKIKAINTSQPLSSQHIVNGAFYEEPILSNRRIKPELRVAKFVENMKKEILPLKIMLDNILFKCSLLGLYQDLINDKPTLDMDLSLGKNQKVKRSIKRENSNNRVVYSIVFDE